MRFSFTLLNFIVSVLLYFSSWIPEANAKTVIYRKSIYSLPLSLDPIKMNDTSSLLVSNLIYSGLVKFAPDMTIESDLAESWHSSIDGKTLTFILLKNIKFSDGKPITANDFKYSFERLNSEESIVKKYFDHIQEIEVISDNELKIKLKNPYPAFINILAGATAKVLSSANDHSATSGNFYISTINKKDKTIILKPNKFRNIKSNISELWLIETDEQVAIKMALEGKIDDLINWPLAGNDLIFNTGKKISLTVSATWIIGINSRIIPFDNEQIRKTFKKDFNTDKFRKTFYPDAHPSFGYIPPGLPGHQSKGEPKVQTESKRSKEKITIVIPNILSRNMEMKHFIEQDLNQKGWNVEVAPRSWEEIMEGYNKKSLQSFLVSMNMDFPDTEFLIRNFETTNADNFSGYSNNELDSLLHKSRGENNKISRKKLIERALIKIEEAALTINLFHPKANYWISKCINGLDANLLSDVYIDYSKVMKAERCN